MFKSTVTLYSVLKTELFNFVREEIKVYTIFGSISFGHKIVFISLDKTVNPYDLQLQIIKKDTNDCYYQVQTVYRPFFIHTFDK